LDKARRPSAVRAEDVKAEAMIKASDGEEGEVPSYSTGRPFADGSAEEVSNNPFAGRMGAAGAGRGRGRLQASQWSLAAEAKNSKRLRCGLLSSFFSSPICSGNRCRVRFCLLHVWFRLLLECWLRSSVVS
jgi:hypothetical protein